MLRVRKVSLAARSIPISVERSSPRAARTVTTGADSPRATSATYAQSCVRGSGRILQRPLEQFAHDGAKGGGQLGVSDPAVRRERSVRARDCELGLQDRRTDGVQHFAEV